jgi:single-strand DNA-binding protein
MASYNHISLLGTITKEPQEKQLQNSLIIEFSLMSDESYTNKAGNVVNNVLFVDVSIIGNLATKLQGTLHKDDMVIIEGHLKYNSWESNGVKNSKHCIMCSNVVHVSKGKQPVQIDSDKISESEEMVMSVFPGAKRVNT